jgi:hypothetical protein
VHWFGINWYSWVTTGCARSFVATNAEIVNCEFRIIPFQYAVAEKQQTIRFVPLRRSPAKFASADRRVSFSDEVNPGTHWFVSDEEAL